MMKTRLGLAVAIAALTALVVGGPALAQGYTETPTITTFDDDGDVTTVFEAGQAFEIGGKNFNPAFNPYKTTIEQNPTFDLGSITVESDGTFLVTKTIPANIGIGQATLVLTGSGAGAPRVTHAIRIADDVDDGADADDDADDDDADDDEDAAARPSQEQSQQQEQNVNVADLTGTRGGVNLPKTGTNTMGMAAAGAGLVLLGILLLLFSRRRGPRVPSGVLPPTFELPPADIAQAEFVQDEVVEAEIVPDDLSSLPEAEQPHLVEADILALSR